MAENYRRRTSPTADLERVMSSQQIFNPADLRGFKGNMFFESKITLIPGKNPWSWKLGFNEVRRGAMWFTYQSGNASTTIGCIT